MAASQTVVDIRQLFRLDEFQEVIRLQKVIWGFDDVELLPRRLFVVASKIGGQLLGAFDGRKMAAFCVCIPGLKPGGKPYLHSHMLGVLPQYRNTGLGRALKLKQREYAISSGIDLIEWTFDPLEIKNAFFNIERLGAIVRRFVPNQYGATTSPLHGGLPTDRCIAEWWLANPRVLNALGGRPIDHGNVFARVAIPADIGAIKRSDGKRAREIQTRVREQFLEHFSKELAVVGFERSPENGEYLLGPWHSE